MNGEAAEACLPQRLKLVPGERAFADRLTGELQVIIRAQSGRTSRSTSAIHSEITCAIKSFALLLRGNDSAVAVFAGQPVEPLVEGDQRGLNFFRIGEQKTISDCFCRRLRGERFRHLAERRV